MKRSESADTLASRLAQHAANRGEVVAFRFSGRSPNSGVDLTWSELWRRALSTAGGLARYRGQRVGILCPDAEHFVTSLAGIAVAGAIAVPMPAVLSRRSAARIHAILAAGELAAVIAPDSILDANWFSDIVSPSGVERLAMSLLAGLHGDPAPIDDLIYLPAAIYLRLDEQHAAFC